MNDDTVERLELKIAFLERASMELSDVVYAQQRQIDFLRQRLAELASQMETRSQGERPYTLEEEKPPHY
jgi:SlyX protein